jgi:hypothetical protein
MITTNDVSKGDLLIFNMNGELRAGFVTNLFFSGSKESLELINIEVADYGLLNPSSCIVGIKRERVLELTALN